MTILYTLKALDKDDNLIGKIEGFSLESIEEQMHKLEKVVDRKIKEEVYGDDEDRKNKFIEENEKALEMHFAKNSSLPDDDLPEGFDHFLEITPLADLIKLV